MQVPQLALELLELLNEDVEVVEELEEPFTFWPCRAGDELGCKVWRAT